MGSSFEVFVLSILSNFQKVVTRKKNMKLCLLVFAVVLLSSEVTPAPAPIKDIINAFVPQLTKPGLKNHGTNKVLVGAGIKGLGYLTNNQELTDWFDGYDGGNEKIFAFVIGLIIGLVFCSILMSCVASSVNATIVLFAEAPAEFEQNHPELSLQMREAWQKAYPGYDTQ